MVLTCKKHLGPDLWLEIVDYAKNTKDIMRKIKTQKAHYL